MAPPRYPQTVKTQHSVFTDTYQPFVNDEPITQGLISAQYDKGGMFVRSMRILHMHTSDFWVMLWMQEGAQFWAVACVPVPACTASHPVTVDLIGLIPGIRPDDPGIFIEPGNSLSIQLGCTPEMGKTYYFSCEAGEYIAG